MTRDEQWLAKYKDVQAFIEANKRNPSRYDDEERGMYVNWFKHNKKLNSAGKMKEDRVELFQVLLDMMEEYKRVNQWA